MAKTIQVTITSTNYTKLGDYIKDYRSPAFPASVRNANSKNSSTDFDWNDYAGQFTRWQLIKTSAEVYTGSSDINDEVTTNLAAIRNAFRNDPVTSDLIDRLVLQKQYLELPLKPGIQFFIPLEKVSREALLTEGIEVVSNNEPAFKAKALIDLEKDRGYRKVLKQSEPHVSYGDIKVQFPDISVWIWCRGLSSTNNLNSELEGQIFNITPFVTSLNTSQTKNGGNFSIGVVPVVAERDSASGHWILKNSSVLSATDLTESLAHSNLHTIQNVNGSNRIVREQMFLHNIIGSNDVVFIRFETLQMENEQRLADDARYYVDKKELPNRIYDMIGLVDKNSFNTNFETNEAVIGISGRDCSKLFIEDGTYFYSMENKQGVMYVHGGATAKNQYTQRLISTDAYLYLGLYYNNSIEDILKFVIQQLANITVVPNNLFEAYGQQKAIKHNSTPTGLRTTIDKRNKRYKDAVYDKQFSEKDIRTSIEENRQKLNDLKKQITRSINAFRVLEFQEDVSVTTADIQRTSPMIFDQLVNFIENTLTNTTSTGEKVAKFTGFAVGQAKYGGWKEHIYNGSLVLEDIFPNEFVSNDINEGTGLFFRFVDIDDIPLSFDKAGIIQQVYNYVLLKQEFAKLQETADNPLELANGIWQIVKLVIDKKVAKRLLIDASLSSASGSIMNYLKKVAQEPFVELFIDTYKDQVYIIVRQPPTDQVGMLSYLTGNYQNARNLDETDDTTTTPAIVDIEEIDIANDSLVFDDSQVYSWYHFIPQASFIGNSSQFSTTYIPAVFFPEYAEVWGAKSLDLIHNYTNYYSQYQEDATKKEISDLQLQSFYDMKYLIESHQYLPFSRKGSITIKGGDRRIKIGNPIRLLSTGEIFWVDSVSHIYSINNSEIERATTIQVSRGLVEAFVHGVPGSTLNQIFAGQGYKFNESKTFSYFDIINTDLNLTQKRKIPKYKTVERTIDISDKDKSTKDFTDIQNDYNDGNVIEDTTDVRDITNSTLYAPVADPQIEYEISRLDPIAQPYFRRFFNKLIDIGWGVIITSGRRTYWEQMRIWIQNGRKNAAAPGTSKHETGFAMDINVIARRNIGGIKQGTQLRLGGNYEAGRAKAKQLWLESGVPQLAHSMGLMWGGNYQGYSDNVHFQVPRTAAEKEAMKNIPKPTTITQYEQVQDGFTEVVDESAVFSNFQVDREIFNFFLRRQQMGIFTRASRKQLNKLTTTDDLVRKGLTSSDQAGSLSSEAVNKLKNKFSKK